MKINFHKDISQVRGATLVCGLPGIAYIGKLSIDYLIQQLKAELIGEIHSQFFSPYVLINSNGLVELLRNELYYAKTSNQGIFFYTGNAQATSPEGQYYLADQVLEIAVKCGVKRIYSIAAFLTTKPFETPRVFGTTTHPSILNEIKQYGIVPMGQGNISGMNGLIFGLAQIKQMEGVCLLGETLGYKTSAGQYLVDSKAVRIVLDVLTRMLNLQVDMEPLNEQTKQMDDLVSKMTEIEKQVIDEMRRVADRDPSRYIT